MSNTKSGETPASTKEKKKKSVIREWFDAIVFAVIAATLIRWLFIEAFTIPTPSMEKSLLVGDFLFVSKVHYGARTPKTLLQLPLTHQKIWGTEIPSYLDWIQLPNFRLPGFSEIQNNDVVVFNWPPEMKYPTDLKTNYIKRCVGIAGDSLEIRGKEVFINGKLLALPEKVQYSYQVYTNQTINTKVFDRLDITDVVQMRGGYEVHTRPSVVEELSKLDFVTDVVPENYSKGVASSQIFPQEKEFDWSLDDFGPIYIPKKGDHIKIDEKSLPIYKTAIVDLDGNEDATVRDGKLYIDGNQVSEYTFKQNYYFMMGDNRHNSQDSRIWGFVPEDHVLGKGLLIWWSVDPKGGLADLPQRVRWSRIFNVIE